ncbi:MAG: DsrE family protein [Acidobacteria bacterium]|nr:DsrE family protein [Acidobacteriota bacterium]
MMLSRTIQLGSLLAIASTAFVLAQTAVPKAPVGREPHGKLAFVLTTGFEDLQMANMMLKQAKIAKSSGYLEDVAVVVYGRGVQLFENTGARPQPTAQFIRDAQGAGVRFYVCNNALHQMGIPADRLDPKPDQIVPFGIVKLSELISDGYQVLRY